jgi:hypothetical protein
LLLGAPPKVIWIQTGNASTSEISNLIKDRSKQIGAFLKAPDASLLWITGNQNHIHAPAAPGQDIKVMQFACWRAKEDG